MSALPFQYEYDKAGNLTKETYPSGRQVVNEYDLAGRLTGVKQGTFHYAGGTGEAKIKYAAHGGILKIQLGNGLYEQSRFNDCLQQVKSDWAKVKSLLIFNIRHNHYRLIVKVDYKAKLLMMKGFLPHADYARGDWKKWAR